MKKLIVIITAAIGFCLSAQCQLPPDVLTNVPSVNLDAEQFGISSGAVTDGDSARATVMLDYTVYKGFFVRGEVQSSAGNSVIESLLVGGGYAKVWPSVRLYGVGEFGRNWTRARYELQAGAGVAWQPVKDGILSRFSTFYETDVSVGLDSKLISSAPGWVNKLGIRYSF